MTELSPDESPWSRPSPGLPQRRPAAPADPGGPALPQRPVPPGIPRRADPGAPAQPGLSLPRRTTAVRRTGRHRSAHRISVDPDAPALVLAVPAGGSPAERDLAERIAETAAQSCPGAAIRVADLGTGPDSLAELLRSAPPGSAGHKLPHAVVVPLLAGPHPAFDAELASAVGRSPVPVMLAAHLGPHPLLAEALHDRLSQAGLARASRARGLSISAGSDGVLVVVDRGPQALRDAGVTAVLLAARLAVPAAPASLDDPASLGEALARLRETGSARPAISPCVVGPESDPSEFGRLAAALGAPSAAPLADHPAVAQLVAIRYGEALARISVAG